MTIKPKPVSPELIYAYKRCFEGEHGKMVLTDLANECNLFRPLGFDRFAFGDGTVTQDFALNAAVAAARAQVVRHILNRVDYSDEMLLSLEKAARKAR